VSGATGATDSLRATIDRRFLAAAAGFGLGSLLAFGLVVAIIPNPVFGRQIPPEPFAIAVWLASAPLMGLVAATYAVPPAARAVPLRPAVPPADGERGTWLGAAGSLAAFLAIGCPVCNKVALLLLGTSGALSVYAPVQPVIGALSLALLGATAWWRLRVRARAGACPS
jgi:hypothetical protein